MMKNKRDLPKTSEVFFSPLHAIPFLMARPRICFLALAPVAINIVLFAVFVALGWSYVTEPLAESIDVGINWINVALQWIATVFLILLLIILSGLICFLLLIPIGAPFYDWISEQIEKELLPEELLAPPMTIMQSIWHALFEGVRRVLIEIPFIVIILIVGFVPIVGTMAAAVLGFINVMLLLPLDAYSYSLDRRGYTLKQKWAFLKENERIWKPFGAALAALVFIPCNIVWFPPLAAVAATRMYCHKILQEQQKGITKDTAPELPR